MGKLKRNRNNRKARSDPLAGKNVAKDDKEEKAKTSKVLSLINNLQSTIPSEKLMAVGALTVLCEDERLRKVCLREKLVQNIMDYCLNDNNDELVVDAFGLLRNIGLEEGYDVLVHMWRLNIWSAIEVNLGKVKQSFNFLAEKENPAATTTTNNNNNNNSKKKKDDEKQKAQLLYDFTENLLSLIMAIADASEDLYDHIFGHIDVILKLVVDILNWNYPAIKTSIKLHNVLLDFVYVFSTSSLEFIEKLADTATFGFSLDKLTPGPASNHLGFGLIEGIRYQILDALKQGNLTAVEILSRLTDNVLQVNLDELKSAFAPVDNANDPITKSSVNEKIKDNTEADDKTPLKPQVIDQQISGDTGEKVQAKADLQLLEVTIDIYTSAWELIALNQEENKQDSIPEDLLQLIFKRIFPLLVELLEFDDNILHLSDKILVCFNNMAWMFISFDSIPTPWFEASLKLWNIALAVSEKSPETDYYVQKNALNVCWAVLKTVGPQANLNGTMIQGLATKAAKLVEGDLNKIDESVLEFILSTVGLLGTAAVLNQEIDINRTVSQLLLHFMHVFTQLEFINGKSNQKILGYDLVLTSLEQFIEIYSDGQSPYDKPVFIGDGYLGKLVELEPRVKEMYKKIDKNKHMAMKRRAEDSWQTLGQFIQYKKLENC